MVIPGGYIPVAIPTLGTPTHANVAPSVRPGVPRASPVHGVPRPRPSAGAPSLSVAGPSGARRPQNAKRYRRVRTFPHCCLAPPPPLRTRAPGVGRSGGRDKTRPRALPLPLLAPLVACSLPPSQLALISTGLPRRPHGHVLSPAEAKE